MCCCARLAADAQRDRFHGDPHPGNVWVLADGRLGLLDFGSTGRLDALERASITDDLLTALRQRDPSLLREAVLEVATLRRRLDERQLERALARFMARQLGGEITPSAALLQELLQIFLAFGIAMSPTTSLLFRTLATLEGTLSLLCPGYPLVQAAEDFAAELVQQRLAPATWQETAKQELVTVLPILRQAPRHLERVATLLERGELGAHISLCRRPRRRRGQPAGQPGGARPAGWDGGAGVGGAAGGARWPPADPGYLAAGPVRLHGAVPGHRAHPASGPGSPARRGRVRGGTGHTAFACSALSPTRTCRWGGLNESSVTSPAAAPGSASATGSERPARGSVRTFAGRGRHSGGAR